MTLTFHTTVTAVAINGKRAALMPMDIRTLRALHAAMPDCVARDELPLAVGCRFRSESWAGVMIMRLRKALAGTGVEIETVRGKGYRLVLPV